MIRRLLLVRLSNRSLLQLCLNIGSLLTVFRSIGNLLQLCLSNLESLASFSELSLEVQGGQNYFRFVEGTCIIALCLSSLSVLSATFRFWLSLQKLNSICFWTVTSVGENEEKVNTIQPPFLCFFHLQCRHKW